MEGNAMARKGRNIYKRKDGRWEGRVILGYGEDGKRRYHSVYGRNYGETRQKMQEYAGQYGNVRGNGKTIGFILYFWLGQKKKDWKPSTYANYRRIVEDHLLPYWAGIYPEALSTDQVRKFIMTKKDDGLSYGYVRNIFGLFLQALRYYEKEHDNVHYKIPAPALVGKKEDIVDEKQIPETEIVAAIEKILYVNELPEQAGMLIAINSGIRIGELCALQWRDVDLDTGIVHVNKTMQRVRTYSGQISETKICIMRPKSSSSVRDIPLPSNLVKFLRSKTGNPEEYIIPGKKVEYCEPRTLQYRFERFLKTNGFGGFRFHALRHCFASRCIELGFDAKSLCEIMGHSDIRITLQLYVHTSLKQKRMLMERLNSEKAE